MGMGLAGKARSFARGIITRTLDFEFERMPYRLKNVSGRKMLTLWRSELNCLLPRPRTPWYPPQLHVEVSAACSLKCPLCPAGSGAIGTGRGNMSFETFRALMDEMGDYATIVLLWMWGEPFTNHRLPEMISYARSKNVATVTSTNGQHLQTPEEADRLVASGLDNLIVALDGATQETYSEYRRGGDIERVLRCLELVNQAKVRLGSAKPRVNVRTVVNRHNERELPLIEQIARRYHADITSRKSIFALDYGYVNADENFTPDSVGYQSFKYAPIRFDINADWRCRRAWNRMTVLADGSVVSCEFDFNRTEPFGKGPSFREAWWGRQAAIFRKKHLADKRSFPFCTDCTSGWIRTGRETTVEVISLTDPAAVPGACETGI